MSTLKKSEVLGWRTKYHKDNVPLLDEEALRSASYNGTLVHEFRGVGRGSLLYCPMTDAFKTAIDLAKKSRPTCHMVHEYALGVKFFEMSPKYAKAYVMVSDDIKPGNTIRFRYKDVEYKAFVGEVDPLPALSGGIAWWVKAFVLCEGPQTETILVESSTKVS